MTNPIRMAYEHHVAMLERSDVESHRMNAQQIALAQLIKRRDAHASRPRKTEPYKTQWQNDLAAFDALIAELK